MASAVVLTSADVSEDGTVVFSSDDGDELVFEEPQRAHEAGQALMNAAAAAMTVRAASLAEDKALPGSAAYQLTAEPAGPVVEPFEAPAEGEPQAESEPDTGTGPLAKRSRDQLRALARKRGVSASGSKAKIVERLQA